MPMNSQAMDDTPIIIGSGPKALEGNAREIGVPAVKKLVEALDENCGGLPMELEIIYHSFEATNNFL